MGEPLALCIENVYTKPKSFSSKLRGTRAYVCFNVRHNKIVEAKKKWPNESIKKGTKQKLGMGG